MTPLTLELDRLGQRPQTVHYDFPAPLLDASDEEFVFDAPVTGDVTFTRVNQDIVSSGSLRTVARSRCARCLDPVELPVEIRVDEMWARKVAPHRGEPEADDEDHEPDLTHPLEGDRIELAELFRELLVAELPLKVVCSEDCKGICTGCGANLNREPCRCPKSDEAESDTLPAWKRELKNLQLDS